MDPATSVTHSPVSKLLGQLHDRLKSVTDGAVASYIPELAKADPGAFGICLVTAGGSVYEVGDTRVPFTIQSISKPFVYGLALEDNGRGTVLEKVGVEPTGDAFNSISLEPDTGRPRNPMINAGAIAAAGLVLGKTPANRLRRVVDMMSAYAGRPLEVDEVVYGSESLTGHRNRAIGHMLRNYDILSSDPIPTVELYFKQCSVSVECRDLGIMAATLANRGVNPVTGKQAVRGEYVESILSVMGSCGMYDYAGEWMYRVGMPAKSGVAGGIIAVLPGQLGIGVYSPPLDSRGNSVRGIRVCDELSRHWDLHLLNRPAIGPSPIRRRFNAAEISSSRMRTAGETAVLRERGARIVVYQLQGHLNFSTTEVVIRDVIDGLGTTAHVVVDLKGVLGLDEGACRLFWHLQQQLEGDGRTLDFTRGENHPLLPRYFKAKLGAEWERRFRCHADMDLALEELENRILAQSAGSVGRDGAVEPADYELCAGMDEEEISHLSRCLVRRGYRAGNTLIEVGADARELFFLRSGTVSVFVNTGAGRRKRLATFSPGMTFGEMAVIDRSPRSASIVADTDVECDLLTDERFSALQASMPTICIKLLGNLARALSSKLRKANREIATLE